MNLGGRQKRNPICEYIALRRAVGSILYYTIIVKHEAEKMLSAFLEITMVIWYVMVSMVTTN